MGPGARPPGIVRRRPVGAAHRRHRSVAHARRFRGGRAGGPGVPVVVRYTSTEASLGTGTVPGILTRRWPPRSGDRCPGCRWCGRRGGGPVATGEVGRVRLRSAAVMRGYWGGPADRPRGGRTGVRRGRHRRGAGRRRLAHHRRLRLPRRDGRLHLVGRANELYIRGGYNVYPAEVEGALGEHPDVDQVAVVGAPDPVLGEVGVAFVVPTGRCRPRPRPLLSVAAGDGRPRSPTTRRPTGWWSSTSSP